MSRSKVIVAMIVIVQGIGANWASASELAENVSARNVLSPSSSSMHQAAVSPIMSEIIREAFQVSAFSLQNLALAHSHDGGISVSIRLANEPKMFRVTPRSIRSSTFQIVTHDALKVMHEVPAPAPRTFRGFAEGDDGTLVAASIAEGQLTAMIRDSMGRTWVVQPASSVIADAPLSAHVVFDADDGAPLPYQCPVEATAAESSHAGIPRGVMSSCDPIVTKIAAVSDFEFYQYNGSSIAATTASIEAAVNFTSFIYEEQLGITYVLERLDIWNAGNQITPVFVGPEVDSDPLLDDFRDWYNVNLPGVDRRFAHLFSGLDFLSGNVGRAFLSVPCNVTSGYGVNQMNRPLLSAVTTLMHEIGHNWGANHCDGAAGCDIMYSSSNFSTSMEFGPMSTNSIIGPAAPLQVCISPAVNPGADCNHNGLCDADEIAMGMATDSNGTGVPDECEAVHNTTQNTYHPRIMVAIAAANVGDDLVVAPGVYGESVTDENKALTIRSSGGRDVTIIDLTGLGGPGVALTGGTLRGFTIRGATSGSFSNAGGGVEVQAGSPLIDDCIVGDNMMDAGLIGGGIIFLTGTSATVSNSIICNNSPSNTLGTYTNGGGNSFPAVCPVTQVCSSAPGDVNEDGTIDGRDIGSFIDCFLSGSTANGDCLCADLVAGGGVGVADLGLFVTTMLAQ